MILLCVLVSLATELFPVDLLDRIVDMMIDLTSLLLVFQQFSKVQQLLITIFALLCSELN